MGLACRSLLLVIIELRHGLGGFELMYLMRHGMLVTGLGRRGFAARQFGFKWNRKLQDEILWEVWAVLNAYV